MFQRASSTNHTAYSTPHRPCFLTGFFLRNGCVMEQTGITVGVGWEMETFDVCVCGKGNEKKLERNWLVLAIFMSYYAGRERGTVVGIIWDFLHFSGLMTLILVTVDFYKFLKFRITVRTEKIIWTWDFEKLKNLFFFGLR